METKERPILFSALMVRAILEGRKTQTRRVVKRPKSVPDDYIMDPDAMVDGHWNWWRNPEFDRVGHSQLCPYGQPGDRLWVREAWRDVNDHGAPALLYAANEDTRDLMEEPQYLCEDGSMNYDHTHIKKYHWSVWIHDVGCGEYGCGWRPSIHMPRWASRIDLEITGVRVERLQDISEADAEAEGVLSENKITSTGKQFWQDYSFKGGNFCASNARDSFATLWSSINGPESWDANPFVWVVEFKRV